MEESKEFFDYVSKKYSSYGNVIYEKATVGADGKTTNEKVELDENTLFDSRLKKKFTPIGRHAGGTAQEKEISVSAFNKWLKSNGLDIKYHSLQLGL